MIIETVVAFALGVLFGELLITKKCPTCRKLIFPWQPKTGHVIHNFGSENEKPSVRSYYTHTECDKRGGATGRTYKDENDLIVVN